MNSCETPYLNIMLLVRNVSTCFKVILAYEGCFHLRSEVVNYYQHVSVAPIPLNVSFPIISILAIKND